MLTEGSIIKPHRRLPEKSQLPCQAFRGRGREKDESRCQDLNEQNGDLV